MAQCTASLDNQTLRKVLRPKPVSRFVSATFATSQCGYNLDLRVVTAGDELKGVSALRYDGREDDALVCLP